MKYALVAIVVLTLAVPAFASPVPCPVAFVSFTGACPDPYVHYTDTVSGVVDCYLVLDCLDGGVRTVSFSWTTSDFAIGFGPQYLLPDAQAIGGPDDPNGWVIASPVCTYPSGCGIVVVVRQAYFVLSPGTITLGPHPVDGKMVVDCNFDADFFIVYANGGIGMDPPEDDWNGPVEQSSWGTIKSTYR